MYFRDNKCRSSSEEGERDLRSRLVREDFHRGVEFECVSGWAQAERRGEGLLVSRDSVNKSTDAIEDVIQKTCLGTLMKEICLE